MKVTIKTLQQATFPIEFEEDATVLYVKELISTQKNGVPVSRQKLIHAGRVLEDSKKMGETAIREGDFIILMSVNPPASNPPASVSASASLQSTNTKASDTATISQGPESSRSPSDSNNQLLTGNEYDSAIEGIVNMGFSRPLVIQAMRASFNNPERAVEYLTTGIIPSVDVKPEEFIQKSHGDDEGDAEDEDDDDHEDYRAGEEGSLGSGKLDFLRDDPQFQQLRAVIAQNPQMLDLIINQMAQSSPDLIKLVSENREELKALLLEEGTGDVSGAGDHEMSEDVEEDDGHNQVIQITPAEQEAIDRLGAMGFDPARVVEAFFACERDEELAANYLLEHLEDD